MGLAVPLVITFQRRAGWLLFGEGIGPQRQLGFDFLLGLDDRLLGADQPRDSPSPAVDERPEHPGALFLFTSCYTHAIVFSSFVVDLTVRPS